VDAALWELLRAEAGTEGDRVLEAIIRLARPGIDIPDVRMVSRFGTIATCRIRARDVIAVRARPDVISLKAPRILSPGFEPSVTPPDPDSPALSEVRPTDMRRSPGLGLTGSGVVVAAVDWGVDIDSAAFKWPAAPGSASAGRTPGGTRFLSFWDQRDQAIGPRPDPYGYGSVHGREEIDRALRDPRPYERLGYHPAIADPRGRGSHGTRTLDIAAGNGEANGPTGIAPDADLIFVHLADRNTGGLANFGDSVRLLEAIDFICRTAEARPCVINISAGRLCGPRDGSTLVERAFDELLAATPGRFIVDSAGNYFRWRAHSCGTIGAGETLSLAVAVDPADINLNELEIWYDGADEFAVSIIPPGYAGARPVRLGERADILIAGRVAGRVYHRKHDPNNGDNHIVAYLDPIGHAGNWAVSLEARRVNSGRFHAWIERDDTCRGCQARFAPDDSNPSTTIGSIASSHLPLVVGAYDGHDPDRPVATFSSAGPSRDGRGKPDLVAPGVDVLAARSAPAGASRSSGLLVRGNGTSFATPHVAGAVALCYEAAGSRLTARQIRSLVLDSCDPFPGADPQFRLGCGYLNIPRLLADVRQALTEPASPPAAKEPTMATEDTIVLAAAPAVAYREYLYRPEGQFARWISDRFEVVGRPGQSVDRPPQPGDVLLEVTLGRFGAGQCVTLGAGDPQVVAAPPRLAPGQLLLRPLKAVEMSEPLPVEPMLGTPDLAFRPSEKSAEQESHGTESGAAERSPDLGVPAHVAAGQHCVDHVPLLHSHAGTPPDMVLTWNDMAAPATVDVVVHLHGFCDRGRSMRLTRDIVPVSGLDFTDPQNRSSVGRTSPTLLVLPRGNFLGGRRFDFEALHQRGALDSLVDYALKSFGAQTGAHPARGQLILTAHSGGGASLMRILGYADPDEVHTFDALYSDPSPLITWARQRIARRGGAMRVLYRRCEGTDPASLRVESAIHRVLAAAGPYPNPRWRVESTRVAHMDIPPRFGWRLLADVSADLPGASWRPVRGDEMSDSSGEAGPSGESGDYEALEAAEGYEAFEEYEDSEKLQDYEPLGTTEAFQQLETLAETDGLGQPQASGDSGASGDSETSGESEASGESGAAPAESEDSEQLEALDVMEGDSGADGPFIPAAPPAAHRPLTTAELREAWAGSLCAEREMATIPLLSNPTPVNRAAVGAFTALAEALRRTGYRAHSVWVYNCRNIAQTSSGQPPRASLHAYGLAVDIDPDWNPHRHNVSGPIIFSSAPSLEERRREVAAGVAGTVFTPQQVAAVEAIRSVDGLPVFGWGGRWRTSHDAMHFEIRLTPAQLRRGLAARPGADGEAAGAPEHATCGACDADDERDEPTGELAEAPPWEDAGGRSRWGLYDQLPLGWGQAEAGDD
jgi:subtilisin family serine protease